MNEFEKSHSNVSKTLNGSQSQNFNSKLKVDDSRTEKTAMDSRNAGLNIGSLGADSRNFQKGALKTDEDSLLGQADTIMKASAIADVGTERKQREDPFSLTGMEKQFDIGEMDGEGMSPDGKLLSQDTEEKILQEF